MKILRVCLLIVCIIYSQSTGLLRSPLKPVHENSANVRLPVYVGRGYHIFIGNPKSENRLDPGFVNPIFELAYTQRNQTSDNRYSIPDFFTVNKISTCSLNSSAKSFRGTQSYAQDLATIARVSGGSKIFAFQFSASTSFQKIENQTSVNKDEVVQCEATCQSYEVQLNKFGLPKLTREFMSGARHSYQNKNWATFLSTFGTHYVDQAIMGGRAIQQTVYSYQSLSKMSSLKIDANLAAKASFAKFYGDASFGISNLNSQLSFSETQRKSSNEFYIGGQPPRNGSIIDWQTNVVNNPMPISYQLTPLTELFGSVFNSSSERQEAQRQFNSAIELECQRVKCQQPSKDFPKPGPPVIHYMKSHGCGGNGGTYFQSHTRSPKMELRRVRVRSGKEIDQLQLEMSDGNSAWWSTPKVGGNGGSQSVWQVPPGQFVSQVELRCGTRLDAITFITNWGQRSPQFGRNGGRPTIFRVLEGYRIVGFYGRSGTRIDQIGFEIAKQEYPPPPRP